MVLKISSNIGFTSQKQDNYTPNLTLNAQNIAPPIYAAIKTASICIPMRIYFLDIKTLKRTKFRVADEGNYEAALCDLERIFFLTLKGAPY